MKNRIRELRKERGLTMKQLGNIIGAAESTMSQYETGKRQPGNETLLKLGEFFDVSVGYLLYAEEKSVPSVEKKSIQDGADMEDVLNSLENAEGLMLYGDPLSDEARASIVAAMKLGMEAAKAKNKEKFTPKKYRKE